MAHPPFCRVSNRKHAVKRIAALELEIERENCMIWMIFVGLLVGILAKLYMPGRDPGGIVVTILIGIAGSIVAGFLGRAIGWYGESEPAGFIASILGAIVLLILYRALSRGGRSGKSKDLTRAA
jgi:uncharacterized membrane protein YeaQ/YmgE (transglycosylase-associated protein family)